jgi:hypothetical protein
MVLSLLSRFLVFACFLLTCAHQKALLFSGFSTFADHNTFFAPGSKYVRGLPMAKKHVFLVAYNALIFAPCFLHNLFLGLPSVFSAVIIYFS